MPQRMSDLITTRQWRCSGYVWLILNAMLLLMGGCGTSSDADSSTHGTVPPPSPAPSSTSSIIFSRQNPPAGEEVHLEGAISGKLVLVDNCLRVQSDPSETSYAVIWPHDYALRIEDGEIQILDSTGQVVAQVGNEVSMGGGTFGQSPESLEGVPNLPPCAPPYVEVGEEVDMLP